MLNHNFALLHILPTDWTNGIRIPAMIFPNNTEKQASFPQNSSKLVFPSSWWSIYESALSEWKDILTLQVYFYSKYLIDSLHINVVKWETFGVK